MYVAKIAKKNGCQSGNRSFYPILKSGLESVLRRNSEFLATVTTACCKNAAAVGSGHTLTETVFVATLAD